MTTLNLKPGDIFDLPDGRFRFLEEWEDETLWFIKNTGARLPLSETQLVDMLGAGEAKKVDVFKRSDGRPKSANDLGEFAPAFAAALQAKGLAIVEIDMRAIGPYAVKHGHFPPAPAAGIGR